MFAPCRHPAPRLLALPVNIRLVWKRPVKDKHSHLFGPFVSYEEKNLIILASGVNDKNYFSSSPMTGNKIEGLYPDHVYRLVKYLPVRPELTHVEKVSLL